MQAYLVRPTNVPWWDAVEAVVLADSPEEALYLAAEELWEGDPDDLKVEPVAQAIDQPGVLYMNDNRR